MYPVLEVELIGVVELMSIEFVFPSQFTSKPRASEISLTPK